MVITGEIKVLSFSLDSPMCFSDEDLARVWASLTIEVDGVEVSLKTDHKEGVDINSFPIGLTYAKIEIIGNKINFYEDGQANKSN